LDEHKFEVFALFLWPIGTVWLLGTLALLAIIVSVFQSALSTGLVNKPGWWHVHVRPVFLIIAMGWVWGALFGVISYCYANQEAWMV
jgi:hypothetical protein